MRHLAVARFPVYHNQSIAAWTDKVLNFNTHKGRAQGQRYRSVQTSKKSYPQWTNAVDFTPDRLTCETLVDQPTAMDERARCD
jgi:hypothetical protein